ncbi:hypothetical protein [Photobacterium leiognathi]|nr:hypothetical protein [Photobacterium leiognathi]
MSKHIIQHLAQLLAQADIHLEPITLPALTFHELKQVFDALESIRK